MGHSRTGDMNARDGETVIDDANAFGQEWQVLDTEPSLFHTVRLRQCPQQVYTLAPPMEASHVRRRFLEPSSSVKEFDAEKACAHWGKGKDDGFFGVLTTGDLDMETTHLFRIPELFDRLVIMMQTSEIEQESVPSAP
jgi:hypothetical protein